MRHLLVAIATIIASASGCRSEIPTRHAQVGQVCAEHEMTVEHPGPVQDSVIPSTYTCVRCASREDVLVAIHAPAARPPPQTDDPNEWRCKQRCYADYQCKVGRCISGWFDPHCTEPGRPAIIDGQAPP
jgi:hypothetical protein